ncbi:MAG: CBM96 family carbohydrate-binding protein [Phycisphaerae bacterium]
MRTYLTAGALMAVLAGSCFGAAVVTTATGNGADTYVTNDQKNAPTEALGNAKLVEVRQLSGDPSRVRIAYLRFDLSSVQGDKTGATLVLSMYKPANRARSLTVYGLKDGEDDNWPEKKMSYSTAPGMKKAELGKSEIDGEKLKKLGTITFAEQDETRASTAAELPLDSFIKEDTNGLVTLVLVDDASDADGQEDYYIDSKEGKAGAAPRLVFPNATGGDANATTMPAAGGAEAGGAGSQPAKKEGKGDSGLP